MPQVAIGRPFDELEASHELGPQPVTLPHPFGGQALAPSAGVGLGKVNPNVPAAFLKQVNALRAKIIAGKIKPPAKLG